MSASAYPITCPVCGVKPLAQCRATTSGRVSDTHALRIDQTYGNSAKGIAKSPSEIPPEGARG